MLRLMLDAHPELAIPPETAFLPLVVQACGDAADLRKAFLETVTSHRRWADLHLDRDALAVCLAAGEPFDLGSALRTVYQLYAQRFGKLRWGDKTPNYVREMTLIQTVLPEAHFIHLIRDGRDVALSVRDVRHVSNSVGKSAERWMSRIVSARRQARELAFYLEVRYEELVLTTEPTLRRICEFIELPWHPQMLDYFHTADERLEELVTADGRRQRDVEERRGKHAWTRRPPDAGHIGRWRDELSRTDRAEFENLAGALLRELGYD